jgi:vanillate O-demethylase monooxygenase subunit
MTNTHYLQNAWYVAGWDSEIQEPTRRMMLDVPILLFRDSRGNIHAMKDACSHRFAPLSRGKVCGDEIQCPYHGLRFNTAGECTHNPHGDGKIPPNSSVQTYPVELRHGAIWVWMGDAGKCDPALIPDYPAGDLSQFKAVTGHMTVKANYQLIFDNLLDLSHVNYLHPGLRAPNDDVQTRQKTRQTEHSVSAYLWRDNALPNGLQKNFWPADKIGDARGHMHWFAPSNLFLDVGITEVGSDEPGVEVPSLHFLTPAGPYETHYFWALLRNQKVDDSQLDASISALMTHAFGDEDKPMIEAQQENMGTETDILGQHPTLLAPDGAPVRARRLLQKLIKAETA